MNQPIMQMSDQPDELAKKSDAMQLMMRLLERLVPYKLLGQSFPA